MHLLAILLITLLGLYLRLQNLSPFKFYPDSYQNLLVALNIQNYGSVVGFLGQNGMFYPDFFMWTRPVYPLLINFTQMFTGKSLDDSAILVCLITSSLSIPLSYLFVSRLFNSKFSGVSAALLTAISFNHIVWSGFIYTEAPAIFFNLLFLTSLTLNLHKKSLLADRYDLLSGILFALAIFSRYEYIVLFIPLIYLVWTKSENPKQKLFNILLGTTFTSSLILTQLYPLRDLIPVILDQVDTLLWLAFFMIFGLLSFTLVIRHIRPIRQRIETLLPRSLTTLIILITLTTLLQIIFGDIIPFYIQFSSMKKFFLNDFLLALFTVSGLLFMLRQKDSKPIAFFVLLGIGLLWPIYNRINPDMQRYWTHLLPFLIIPASYSATLYLKRLNRSKPLITLLLILIAAQIWVSWNGMKSWNEGIWFKQSYEEKSAKILTEKLATQNKDNLLLLTSMPESYYLYSGFSTHSIADKPPFIFIPDELNDRKIWIIQDIGMLDLFPNFNQIIETKLQDKKIDQYYAGSDYKFAIKTLPETVPVMIYELTLQELKEKIAK